MWAFWSIETDLANIIFICITCALLNGITKKETSMNTLSQFHRKTELVFLAILLYYVIKNIILIRNLRFIAPYHINTHKCFTSFQKCL